MKRHETFVKVRYAETDQMGVVHHGNYPQYLEISRIEWLEQFGLSYNEMEKSGIMLPVYEMDFKFLKPATFDEELKIVTELREMPRIKITFNYIIYNQKNEVITTASTTLVFMDSISRKPIKCPDYVLDRLRD